MLKNIDLNFIILIVGRFLQIVIAFLAIRLATNFLSASEMGNYYLIASIASFFGFFLVGPIGQYINRKTHQMYNQKSLINMLYLYNFYIFFLAFLSVPIINGLYYFGIGNNINVLYLSLTMMIYIIFHTWNQTIIPMINMLERRVVFVVFTVSSQTLLLILSLVFIEIFDKKGIFWFLGQGVAFGLVALIAFIYFIKRIQSNFKITTAHRMVKRENIKKILLFSFPLSISALFFWLQSQSYTFIIEKEIGSNFLGYFGVGIAVSMSISSVFETIVMQYIYPKIYKHMDNEEIFHEIISNVINFIIPIYLLLAIFISFFSAVIINILVDVKYYESYIFVIFGAWIAFFRMSSNILANIAHSKMNTKTLIFPNFLGALVVVCGLLIVVHMDNYKYLIPSVILLAGIVSFISMYAHMYKLLRIKILKERFVNIFVYSLPFMSVILFEKKQTIIESLLIIFIYGLYFLFVLYKFTREKVSI